MSASSSSLQVAFSQPEFLSLLPPSLTESLTGGQLQSHQIQQNQYQQDQAAPSSQPGAPLERRFAELVVRAQDEAIATQVKKWVVVALKVAVVASVIILTSLASVALFISSGIFGLTLGSYLGIIVVVNPLLSYGICAVASVLLVQSIAMVRFACRNRILEYSPNNFEDVTSFFQESASKIVKIAKETIVNHIVDFLDKIYDRNGEIRRGAMRQAISEVQGLGEYFISPQTQGKVQEFFAQLKPEGQGRVVTATGLRIVYIVEKDGQRSELTEELRDLEDVRQQNDVLCKTIEGNCESGLDILAAVATAAACE